MLPSKRVGDQVDRFRGAACVNDLMRIRRVDEVAKLDARFLVRPRSTLAQKMRCPMDVGVIEFVIVDQRIDDRTGLLRRIRAVEIDQRLAMYELMQNRKILPNPLYIEALTYG